MPSDHLVVVTDAYMRQLSDELIQARDRLTRLDHAGPPSSLGSSPALLGAYTKFVADWSDKRSEIARLLGSAAQTVQGALDAFHSADADLANRLRGGEGRP